MGSSTETIHGLHFSELMQDYGGLNKYMFMSAAEKISQGMPTVKKLRQDGILYLKSMYNSGYLKAMGYEPINSIYTQVLNNEAILDFTKTNIDSSATSIVKSEIRAVSIFDKVLVAIQNKPNFNADNMSYSENGVTLLYASAVENGPVIDITYYKTLSYAQIKSALDAKYPTNATQLGYTINYQSSNAVIVNGSLQYVVKLTYSYIKTTTIPNPDPKLPPTIIKETITETATEYFPVELVVTTIANPDNAIIPTIISDFTKPVTYTDTYKYTENMDGVDYEAVMDMTITGTQTATRVGNSDVIELTFNFTNPYDKYQTMHDAWESVVLIYQAKTLALLEDTLSSLSRKLTWTYNTPSGSKFAYTYLNRIPNLFIGSASEAYPIIPIKEYYQFTQEDYKIKNVLSKVGLKAKDFHASLSDTKIVSAYLQFGLRVHKDMRTYSTEDLKKPLQVINVFTGEKEDPDTRAADIASIVYIYKYLEYITNSSDISKLSLTNNRVTTTIGYQYKSAAGMLQTVNVGIVSTNTPATSQYPIGCYWLTKGTFTEIVGYDEVISTIDDEGNTTVELIPIYDTYQAFDFHKQVDANYRLTFRLYDLKNTYIIGGQFFRYGLNLTRGSSGKFFKSDEGVKVPIIRNITNPIRFDFMCHIIERSMTLIAYSKVTVKTKWYQSGLFMFVVAAVTMYVGGQYIVAASAASTATAAVTVAGVTMSATTALVIGVGTIALTFASLAGVDLGIFGVVAAAALAVVGGYALLSATNTMTVGMTQVVMLSKDILGVVVKANDYFFNRTMEHLNKQQNSALSAQTEELKKAKEELNKLTENSIPGGINMFGSEVLDIDSYYDLSVGDIDQYELMYNFAVDYDSKFKTV